MSLPNDNDDDDRRPPWRGSFGPGDGHTSSGIYPIKKLTVVADGEEMDNENDDDNDDASERTAAETSIGSMSFSSDITSVVHGVGGSGPLVPQAAATPISALTLDTRRTAGENDSSSSVQSSGSSVSVSRLSNDEVALRERRRRNLRQLQQLGIATGVSFSIFLYLLIPTALLMSMILFGGVSVAFVTRLAIYMQWEFQRSVLEGRGIGEYLPAGVYEALTSTSLHDFLSDPEGIFGVSEHMPYIVLYLIPGLTLEQRNEYVNRLSPIHQRLLRNQQGLLGYLHNRNRHRPGNEAGDSSFLMRLVMGDERLRQQQMQNLRLPGSNNNNNNGNGNHRLELPPTIPEGASWGDASELAADDDPASAMPNDNSETHANETIDTNTDLVPFDAPAPVPSALQSLTAEIPAIVSPIVGRAVVLDEPPPEATGARRRIPPPPPPTVETTGSREPRASTAPVPSVGGENSEQNAPIPEDVVLFDAIGAAISNIVGEAAQTVRTRARESLASSLGGPVFRASVGATALGLGIGAFGLWSGTYDAESLARPVARLLRGLVRGSPVSPRSRGTGTGLSLPAGSVLVGATLASGTTAVVLGAFGIYRRGNREGKPPSERRN